VVAKGFALLDGAGLRNGALSFIRRHTRARGMWGYARLNVKWAPRHREPSRY
jgi:hypothetical protein